MIIERPGFTCQPTNPSDRRFPSRPDVGKIVKDYKSNKSVVTVDEAFEPRPLEIQKNDLAKGKLESGVTYSFLPKSTRETYFTFS